MKKLFFLVLLTAGLSASAADTTANSTTDSSANKAISADQSGSSTAATAAPDATANTTAEAGTSDSPKAVCTSIAQAAKAKNFESVMKMTVDVPRRQKTAKMKNEFQKMQSQNMEKLQDLSCTNEIIAQDHAMVEADSQGQKRLIPFLKTDNGWKFDMKTYEAFYHTEKKMQKKQKM